MTRRFRASPMGNGSMKVMAELMSGLLFASLDLWSSWTFVWMAAGLAPAARALSIR